MPLEQCPPTVHVLPSSNRVADHVANLIIYEADSAIALKNRFVIGFSGGSIPSLIGPELAKRQTDFSKWWILFVDERCVPHSDPDSNYGLLKSTFLSHVPIPPKQVFAIDEEAAQSSPDAAAEEYEKRIKASPIWQNDCAFIDTVLLGVGPDGHTASLFPDRDHVLDRQGPLFEGIKNSPKPPPCRITMTLRCFQLTYRALFVVCGASKREILGRIMKKECDVGEHLLPACLVHTMRPVCWFIDSDADPGISQIYTKYD